MLKVGSGPNRTDRQKGILSPWEEGGSEEVGHAGDLCREGRSKWPGQSGSSEPDEETVA